MPRSQRDWLTAPVERRHRVAVNKVQRGTGVGGLVILTDGGAAITVTHANDNGAAGSGTFEDPHGTLTAANGAATDIVYVHSGTTFNNQSYAAAADQRILGEGAGNQHLVQTDQLGTINLPGVNGIGGARPAVSGAVGPATFDAANGAEFSNFQVTGPLVGVRGNGITGNVNVNRMLISGGTTGIDIVGGSGTFSITGTTISDAATAAINVNGGSADVNFGGANSPGSGLFGGSSISQNAAGSAVSVTNGHSGTFVHDTTSIITASAGTGLQFNDADGTYTFDGPVTLAGGDAGIDILGNSNGTFTFGASTSIVNPSGTAFNVTGDTTNDPNVTYSGTIANNSGSAILVQDTTGANAITFDSGASDAIQDSAGGIVLNNVDQSVNVSADTELTGAIGIDIDGGSGTFTFSDTDISNTNGAAGLDVAGGSSTINFLANSSIAQNLNQPAVNVSGSHTGVLTVDGTTTATNGTGLQFDNADGTYNFNGQVTLNGGDAGIDILSFSDGSFTFADASITSPTGAAFNISSGDVNVTYNGDITQANNAPTVSIVSHVAGNTVAFQNGTISATNGSGLQFFNADGTYNFSDQVTLNGGDAGIDILATSDGTFTFSNTDITNPSGIAVNVDGGASDVTFQSSSSVSQANNATALNVQGGHTGSVDFDVSSAIAATNGDGIQFNNADGSYNINSATTLNGGDAGVDIINGSDGVFSFVGSLQVTNATGIAVNIDGGGGGQSAQVSMANLDIDQSVGDGIVANNSTSLSVSFSSIDNASDDGIDATNTDLSVAVTTISLNNANTRGINFANNLGGSINLVSTDVDMNSAAGTTGIRVENTSAALTVNLSGIANTSINAATATQSVDAGGGFSGTINVNGGADNLP